MQQHVDKCAHQRSQRAHGKSKQGAVNSEVMVTLGGGAELVAINTKASAQHLALKTGDTVEAIVKAFHVILGVE